MKLTPAIERRLSPEQHKRLREECYEMSRPYVRKMAELHLLFTTPKMTYNPATSEYRHSYTWNDEAAHEAYDRFASLIETMPSFVVKQQEILGML